MTIKIHKDISHRFAHVMWRKPLARSAVAPLLIGLTIAGMSPAYSHDFSKDLSVKEATDKGFKSDNWIFLPSVVSGLRYDNNLFKNKTDKTDDLIAFSAPKITVLKRFKSGELTFTFETLFAKFLFNDSLSSEDIGGSIAGAFKITPRSELSFSTSLRRSNELVSAVNNDTSGFSTNEPLADVEFDSSITLSTTLKRFSHALKLGYTNTDYEDVGGVDQDIRNSESYSISSEVGYVVSRHITLTGSTFSSTTLNENNPIRDVTSYGINSGFKLDVSSKLSAAFNFGLTKENFHNAGDTDWMPSYEATLEWKPRRYLTVSLIASQDETSTDFEESNTSPVKTKGLSGEVSYDVTRKLALKAEASITEVDIIEEGRRVEGKTVGLSAQYAINSSMGIVVSYSHENRETSDGDEEFERDTVQGSFIAKF